MRRILSTILFFLAFLSVSAQLPHDFRSEQIFMGVGKTEWNVNDTISLNGVVACMSANSKRPYSRYLYVELMSTADSVLVRQKVACGEDGNFRASIPTQSVYNEGVYYIRAYTSLMRNFSGESFALQPVLIGKTFPKRGSYIYDDVQCAIYPEGGFLVADQIQGVTVALTTKIGDALGDVPVSVSDDRGNIVCEGKTQRSGLLSLKFIPQAGRQYKAVASIGGKSLSSDIPQPVTDRMKLQCAVSGNRLKFELLNAPAYLSAYRLYLYNKESGLTRVGGMKQSGVVALVGSPRITTVFLTDSTGNVLSEATSISRYDMADMPQTPDTMSVADVATLADRLSASSGKRVLVRLADDNERWLSFAEGTLLYTSDYSAPLPFPEAFFKESARERSADLQAWLGTATFKRFCLSDAIAKDTAMYVYMPESNMTIGGIVQTDERIPRAFGKGNLVAYNTSNNFVYDTAFGKDGRFRMAVDDFADGTTFYLQAIDKREKPVGAKFTIDDETYPAVASHNRYELQMPDYAESRVTIEGTMSGRILPNVVVKARVRHEEPVSTQKFYAYNYVDREKIERFSYLTLLDILKSMAGTNPIILSLINRDKYLEFEGSIHSSRGASTLAGNVSMPILLDGTRIFDSEIANVLQMSADDIEEVEILKPWQALAYTWGALDGAIRVTTRSLGKKENVRSLGTYYTPMGLSAAEAKPLTATPGRHRLLIDIVSPDGVASCERMVVVK